MPAGRPSQTPRFAAFGSHRLLAATIGLAAAGLAGCVGNFAGDGSSLSIGSHSRGALVHAVAMPFEGAGYRVHPRWRPRNHRYATEGVARWLTNVFREVAAEAPGSVVHLGDLSAKHGGDAAMHRSHASGRDVDLFFLTCDSAGQALPEQPAMLHLDGDGRARRWSPARPAPAIRQPVPDARFDARRNWLLVRAMLTTPGAEVQWIFVDRPFAALLLAEAEREGASQALVGKAEALLHQPSDSQAHDDHMHVRLFCSPSDRLRGCSDKGPRRWLKKHWKYMSAAEPMSPSRS